MQGIGVNVVSGLSLSNYHGILFGYPIYIRQTSSLQLQIYPALLDSDEFNHLLFQGIKNSLKKILLSQV